jgi:predicted glycosyltransferase
LPHTFHKGEALSGDLGGYFTIAPALRLQRNETITVDDEGDHWAVYSGVPVRTEKDQIIVTTGGGGLGLKIDKCTGTIFHAAYQK